MPTYMYGDMIHSYDPERSWLLFTANSYVNNDGALVMGAGMAKQVAYQYPYLRSYFGSLIMSKDVHLGTYHILSHSKLKIAAFQVKRDWRLPAILTLIEESAAMLNGWARGIPSQVFNLNYPGIGNGKLSVEQVEPILASLPDNVHVWRLK